MDILRQSIVDRITDLFAELKEKTNLKSKYWVDKGFVFESGLEFHISDLEQFFNDNHDILEDYDLLNVYEFLIEESNYYDFEGFN